MVVIDEYRTPYSFQKKNVVQYSAMGRSLSLSVERHTQWVPVSVPFNSEAHPVP